MRSIRRLIGKAKKIRNFVTVLTDKVLIKNLGVIVLIIGAAVLAVPFFTGGMTNSILLTGLGLVLLGYFGHIVINKRVE